MGVVDVVRTSVLRASVVAMLTFATRSDFAVAPLLVVLVVLLLLTRVRDGAGLTQQLGPWRLTKPLVLV